MTGVINMYASNPSTPFFEDKINQNLLLDDFDELISLHKIKDPGMNLFQTKASLDSLYLTIKSELNEPKTRIEFLRIIHPYIQKLGEKHNEKH